MSTGEIVRGGMGAMITPAGLVLILPAVAWTLVLARRERPGRSAIGVLLLMAAFALAVWMLRPDLVPTPSAPFARVFGGGWMRDAALLGLVWILAGVLAIRRDLPASVLELTMWLVGGLLLAPLIPPLQGPVLAVVTGPRAVLASPGARGLYDAGLAVALGILVALAALVASRLPRPPARRVGGGVLVVWGIGLATGAYGRVVAMLLERWPASGLG
jgi:hypothetical protein